MKISTERLMQAKTLISFGLRPQQIKMLTGVNESRLSLLTKEVLSEGTFIATKGSLSANKILRTKNHFRQFSIWMIMYKSILSAESNFQRHNIVTPWFQSLDCNVLIKTHILFANLLQNEFNIDDVIDASECFSILTELDSKESTYLVFCPDCNIEYVIIESSKQTDNCPFCHERGFETEKNKLDLIFDNLLSG